MKISNQEIAKSSNKNYFSNYLLIVNILVFNCIYFLSLYIFEGKVWIDGRSFPFLYISSNVLLIFSFWISGVSKLNEKSHIYQIVYSSVLQVLILIFFYLVLWIISFAPKIEFNHILFALFLFLFTIVVVNKLYINLYRTSKFQDVGLKNAIIIGNDVISFELIKALDQNKWLGYNVVDESRYLTEDTFQEIVNKIEKDKITCLFINSSTTSLNDKATSFLKEIHENLLVEIKLYSDYFSGKLKRSSYELYGKIPIINMFSYPLDNSVNQMWKRLFDIIFSSLFLILIGVWLFPIIAISIKLNSKGTVFYLHERIGKNGSPFVCFKFRTMYTDCKSEKWKQTTKNDNRITKIGHFLRKNSIDELPQLINVLIGDISLVGPRPMMIEHMKEYDSDIKEIYSRHWIKPGVTGLAQVSGYRGEIDSTEKMKGRIRMDKFYINNWTFFLDLKIIWWTIRNLLQGDSDAI